MTLWRISNHASLSGEGGRRGSARWHTEGRPIVYLAASAAGALLEILAQDLSLKDQPDVYQWLEVAVDPGITADPPPKLKEDWREDLAATQSIGNTWLKRGASALMEVPSVLAPHTSNYLLNPRHPDARRIRIVSTTHYPLDARFITR